MARSSAPKGAERPVYLSLQKAAELHDVSVDTIRRRIADGTIPAIASAASCASVRVTWAAWWSVCPRWPGL